MKLILFDLDGTLIDSLQDLADSCNDALRRKNLPQHAPEDYRYLVGKGIRRLLLDAAPESARDEATQTQLKENFDRYYEQHYLDATAPYPGIISMLETLRSEGWKMGVLSNKPHAFAELILQGLSLHSFLDAYSGQKNGAARKPDPTSALQMIRDLGCLPKETCYVGDSDVDIQTAKNAGVCSIGVSWGFRGRGELQRSGADYIADSPAELTLLLRCLNRPESVVNEHADQQTL